MRVDIAAGVEPFGRQVREGAEVVSRDLSTERQRFRDAEVEDLDLIAFEHAYVPGLQVSVHERSQRLAVDRRLEAVRRLEKVAQLDGHVDRALGRERPARNRVREVLPLQVLHRDVEVPAARTMLVDFRHVPALCTEPLLKLRAPPLGVQNLARFAIGARRHQLERHSPVGSRVRRQEDGRHPAAADFADDFVRSDAVEDRVHQRPRRPLGMLEGRP